MILSTRKKTIPAILFLSAMLLIIIFFVPPENPFVIGGLIVLTGYIVYIIAKQWLSRKISFILFSSFSILLLLKAYSLFDTINAILLLSLTVAILILIK